MSAYTEVKGVEWCVAHRGISDECGDHGDHCDMADAETCETCGGHGVVFAGDDDDIGDACSTCDGEGNIWGCDIRTLYVEGDKS